MVYGIVSVEFKELVAIPRPNVEMNSESNYKLSMTQKMKCNLSPTSVPN